MQLMDDHLWYLYKSGLIDEEEMIDKCRRPNDMAEKLNQEKSASLSMGKKAIDQDTLEPAMKIE